MRKAFISALCELAELDERILLLTGDLGYMAMEDFRDRFPSRFMNVGVAEQNMIGIATGLAEAGFLPFAYSIATFVALRPFEFIRNGPVLHRLPVRIVGVGMGFEYGHAGPTHYALEDIGVLRTLPGLTIVIPADAAQASEAVRKTWNLPGPVYYSLGKDDRLSPPGLDGRFDLGRVQTIREGRDLVILTIGSISAEVVHAAEDLSARGIESTLAIVSCFHPDPVDDLREILSRHRHAISVEAQTISGGLASLIGMVIAEHGIACRLWPMAVRTSPDGTSGSQPGRWRKHGLDQQSIVAKALQVMGVAPS